MSSRNSHEVSSNDSTSRSTSRASGIEMNVINDFNAYPSFAEEPLSDDYFERKINANLNWLSSNDGVFDKFVWNQKKNKKRENTRTIIEWIKSGQEKLDKVQSNFKEYSQNVSQYNESLRDRLLLIEERVTKNEKETEQYSKRLDEIVKDFGDKFSMMEKNDDVLKSTVEQMSTLENKIDSFANDFADKLSNTERTIKSEFNLKIDEIHGTLNILGHNLESTRKSLSGEINSMFKNLSSLSDELSDLKSNVEQIEIQVKKNATKCEEREKIIDKKSEKSVKSQDEKNIKISKSLASVEKNTETLQNRLHELEQSLQILKDEFKKQTDEDRERKNNLKKAISKVEGDQKNYDRRIGELIIDTKFNKAEITRVEQNFIQSQHHELRTRTSVIEGSRGNDWGGRSLIKNAANAAKIAMSPLNAFT